MGIESIPSFAEVFQYFFGETQDPKVQQWNQECKELHKRQKEGTIRGCVDDRRRAASQKPAIPLSRLKRCLQGAGSKTGDIQSCHDKEKLPTRPPSREDWETLRRIMKGKGSP